MAAMIGKYENIDLTKRHLMASELAGFLKNFKENIHKKVKEYFDTPDGNGKFQHAIHEDFKAMKRITFQITYNENFPWAGEDEREESFAEIVNQFATIESMIWVLELHENKNSVVLLAHPTQTSNKNLPYNNDLVLKDLESNTVRVYEISDTVSKKKDVNSKFLKDLNSLHTQSQKETVVTTEYYIVCSNELWGIYRKKSDHQGSSIKFFSGETWNYESTKIKCKIIEKHPKDNSEMALLEIKF